MMLSNIGIKAIKKAPAAIRTAGTLSSSAHQYSFASPEADFYNSFHRGVEVVDTSSLPTWTQSLSYGTPENDFVAANIRDAPEIKVEWSGNLSFASPEADCTAVPDAPDMEWSGNLSFASPEADFASLPEQAVTEWSEQMSFASPESDFVAAAPMHTTTTDNNAPVAQLLEKNALQELMASPVMSMAISSPESASGSMHTHHLLEDHELYQLHQATTATDKNEAALPSTLEEALSDARAIVVTEAKDPFHIVDVNDAWVGLCGFSKEEARNQSLSLIQGPDTNQRALDMMVEELLHGRETTTLVTNYDKKGRKFYNKLKAGPIKDSNDNITHLVGILQEVSEQPEYFHNSAVA